MAIISKGRLAVEALCAASVVAGYLFTGALLGSSDGPGLADQFGELMVQEPANMGHSHSVRNVADAALAPQVSHLVFPDAVDGYNIQILIQNFRFTPSTINGAVKENTGHAHVYVNGAKVIRVYSDWVHLPGQFLQPGANLVTVTLNANDHSTWGVDGAPIASSVRVAGPVSRDD